MADPNMPDMPDDEDDLTGEQVQGAGPHAGEMVDAPDDVDDGVEDTGDGGALVTLDDESPVNVNPEFYANLAETMDQGDLATLASVLSLIFYLADR